MRNESSIGTPGIHRRDGGSTSSVRTGSEDQPPPGPSSRYHAAHRAGADRSRPRPNHHDHDVQWNRTRTLHPHAGRSARIVEIFNGTDVREYVHWHGFDVPPELDGTEEEGSLAVPAGGHLQYEITPLQPGSRYVHSHAMTMNDLSRGVYSGQFAFVYVEPRRNAGRYDQEIFLATHEWEPRLVLEQYDEIAEEDEDETEQTSMEIR